MLDELKKAKEGKSLLALYRDNLPESADYTGFPVLVGRDIVLLARENDFSLDGYAAIRLRDITFLEQVDDNAFIHKILAGEKLYDRVQPPRLTGTESWKSVLDGVKASFGGWLSVESCDGEGSCFFMGTISRLDSNFLYMRQIEADGNLHQEETTVPLQDLVTVAFGGRYIELYRKYAGMPPPARHS